MTHLETRPTSLTPSEPEGQPTTPNRRGFPTKRVIGGVVLAGLLTGGGVALANANHTPSVKPEATNGSTPNATPSTNPNNDSSKPEVFTATTVEIPANLNADQLGTAFVDRLTSWESAGTDDETVFNNFISWTGSNESYGDKVAADNATVYKTMFVDHDKDSPLGVTIDNITAANSSILVDWLKTYKSDVKADRDNPFTIKSTLDPGSAQLAKSADGANETLTFDMTTVNNSEKNSIGVNDPAQAKLNGEKTYGTVTFTKVGDNLEISAMDLHD